MKIDEIIKKSIEVPGISIKRSEYSAELILKEKDGKGSMTFFPLFPGLTLAYIFINSPTWAAPDFRDNGSIETGPLLLNYCVTGRCELILNNGNFVYVKDGEISLTERFARQQYVYPRRIYEGMEFFIDMDAAAEQSAWMQAGQRVCKCHRDCAHHGHDLIAQFLALGKPPRFSEIRCYQTQQDIGQTQRQQLCQLFRGHSPRSCSLCRTLPGSSAAACTSSCSFANTEGRLSLFSRDAEYSLNAELKASASGALKKTRYRGGTSEVSLRMA